MAKPFDLMQGTLDMLILKSVSLEKLHGYGVLLRIQQISSEQLVIQQGSLYPALSRLEHEGAIRSEWCESENNRRAKYYTLTPSGRSSVPMSETGSAGESLYSIVFKCAATVPNSRRARRAASFRLRPFPITVGGRAYRRLGAGHACLACRTNGSTAPRVANLFPSRYA